METLEPMRILFVQDAPADIELAERALHKEGLSFISVCVNTENDFRAALDTFSPDVVISDYALATFDGLRALQLSLERDATRPFILLTNSLNEETAVSCLKAGATDYVLKERLARLPLAVTEAMAQRATGLAQERTEEENRQHLRELEAVNRVSTALRVAYTLDEILSPLMDETLHVVSASAGLIALYDPELGRLQRVIARGWLAQVPLADLREGIAGRVFKSDERYIAREFATDSQAPEILRRHAVPGWGGVCLPIRAAESMVGMLVVSTYLPRELTRSEIHTLEVIAEIAGIAVHRVRLYEQTALHVQRLDGLRMIDNAISASLDLRITLEVIFDQVVTQLGVSAVDVLLSQGDEHLLNYVDGRGFWGEAYTHARARVGEGLVGRAALERRLMYMTNPSSADLGATRAQLLADEKFVTCYAVPLITKGQVRGVLEMFERTLTQHNREWFDFLQALADQTAIAIDNLEMFNQLQRTNLELGIAYDMTIEGWSRALDLRDHATEGHTERVADLTVQVARCLGIPENDLVDIRRGALLHDIGKMGIPDTILFKPGALDENEWEIMRRHPVFAYDLLLPIPYLCNATVIPYNHHERWDGSGYPRGLKGEAIPLPARIFAVVDVWDALTSDRPYRPAWSRERALAYIREQSGVQFDPHVVEAFFKTIG